MVASVTVQRGASTPPRALRFAQRMDALGISANEFAKRSGADRESINRARVGTARNHTYGKLERALDELEAEIGPLPDQTVATVDLPDGTRVTYRGMSAEEAAQFVAEFLERRNQERPS